MAGAPSIDATGCIWKLAGVHIDQIAAVGLVINRGIEASLCEFVVRDGPGSPVEQLKGKPNPVELEITAPDLNGQPQTLKLEQWHITDIYPHAPGFLKIVVQDNRWKARQRKLTADYNVYQAAGTTRTVARVSSLKPDGTPWTCYEAAQDALARYGLAFEAQQVLPADLVNEPLPRNLGNAKGGGFVGMDFEAAMPLLTEPAQLDMVVLPNGNVTLTDRDHDAGTALHEFIGIDGSIGMRDISRQLPAELIIRMEQRLERRLALTDTSTAAEGLDPGATMVIPRDISIGGPTNLLYVPFDTEVADKWGLNMGAGKLGMRRRYFWPFPVAISGNDSLTRAQEKAQANIWIKESYRRVFRIDNVTGRSTLVDLSLGHIAPNGTTRSKRSVYMGYSYIARALRSFNPGATAQAVAALQVSENIPFRTIVPAPFEPVWGYDNHGDLILRIDPEEHGFALEIFPGELSNPLHFGQVIDLADKAKWLTNTLHDATLATGWVAYVVYHALLVADRPDLGLKRLHEVRRPLFPDGAVPSVEFFVRDMTANHALQDVTLFAVQLANEAEINARCDNIEAQVRDAFKTGKAGVFKTGGVDAIVRGKFWPRGNIYSLVIMLGATQFFTVEAQWTVMPNIRPIYTEDVREMLQGAPVRELA